MFNFSPTLSYLHFFLMFMSLDSNRILLLNPVNATYYNIHGVWFLQYYRVVSFLQFIQIVLMLKQT